MGMMMLIRMTATCAIVALLAASSNAGSDAPGASQPAGDVAQLPDRLRVATFNVEHCEGGIDHLIEFLRAQNADFIFLQEVPRQLPGEPDPAGRIAKALNNMHLVSASTLKIPAEQACDQIILSRFPLSGARAHSVAKGGWVYAVQATTRDPEHPLCLFSVHTRSTAHLTTEQIVQSSTARMEQVSALLDVVRKVDGDVLVAGDFNAAPWMPEDYSITRLLRDFGMANQDAELSFPSFKPSVRIDYVFGRGGYVSRSFEVADSRISDHRPVVAELERKTATSQPASRAQ
jgi:endonuclease/exonuclease/phosphatase family metal-dependent hydrolase